MGELIEIFIIRLEIKNKICMLLLYPNILKEYSIGEFFFLEKKMKIIDELVF